MEAVEYAVEEEELEKLRCEDGAGECVKGRAREEVDECWKRKSSSHDSLVTAKWAEAHGQHASLP